MFRFRNRFISACISLVFSLSYLIVPLAVQSAPINPGTTGTGASTAVARIPVNLDLTSITASLPAPHFAQNKAISIEVGSTVRPLSSLSALTPAERLAAYQVFSTGQQSIQLSALGNAVGGSLVLGPKFSQYVSSLVIPQGVTAVEHLGTSSGVNFTGNLTNAGTFLATSSNPDVTTASITASNITNLPGGLLTTVLPGSGLPGLNGAVSSVNLNLTAISNFINQGNITSSGNLQINAGGTITNQATMTAAHNVSIMSAVGNITNSGVIAAAAGDINISSATGQNILIDNTYGSLSAPAGSINAATSGATGQQVNLAINGGNLAAQELNIDAGQGSVDINVGNLTGRLNISAQDTHVSASTPDLVLGNMNISGDPTFYNTSGDVTIAAPLIFNASNFQLANLAIIASGDILSAAGAGAIDTSGSSSNAGSILMVAGANFVSSGSPSSALPPPPGNTSNTLTISPGPGTGGGSLTGGQINLQGSGAGTAITSLNAAVNSGNGNGGSVTLIAFAGANSGSGTITVPVIITTGTTENDAFALNGNVTIIAGATTGSAITLAGVNSSGNLVSPQAANGAVNIFSATPMIPAGNIIVAAGGGGAGNPITNANFIVGNLQSGSITIGSIVSGANLAISTNGSVNITGSLSLTQSPPAPVTYQVTSGPAISIVANTLTVQNGASVNSQIITLLMPICGQIGCGNAVNITSPTIINNGTIAGNTINLSTSNLTNTGNITGNGSNALINVQSPSATALTISGTGTMTVPAASVIELAAADTQTLQFTGSQSLNTGASSLVIFDAQAAGGNITLGANTTQTISGAPVISINTPQLNFNNASVLNATGASTFAITAGYTANPLTISLANSATATISTGAGGAINMRPIDGQNIVITTPGTSASLMLTGATAILATAAGGSTQGSNLVTVSPFTQVSNPAGGIYGVAFEPYVGGLSPVAPGTTYTLFGAYTYEQVLALLAPIAASQQFQILSTYNQGIVADASSPSGYSQQGAAQYVIEAAKQVGLRVSAGTGFAPDGPGTALSIPGTEADINAALTAAQKYGNVVDIVVGNESIDPNNLSGTGGSLTNLALLISYAQTTLPSYGFTTSTLPVTTRQRHDLLSSPSILANGLATILNDVNGYVYDNVYPYYDNLNLGNTQQSFDQAVLADMNLQYTTLVSALQTAGVNNTDVRIGETGWAVVPPPIPPAAAQATLQNAAWFYSLMQSWSATTFNPITKQTGVPISGFFEAYDEPWKINTSSPSLAGEPYFGIWTASGTTSTVGAFTLTGVTQKYALPLYLPTSPQPPMLSAFENHLPNLFGAFQPSNSTTGLDIQIGTKISTDVTSLGTNPTTQGNNTYTPNIARSAPYADIGGGSSGWQSSENGSVWSCSGCLGTTQNAARLLEEAADNEQEISPAIEHRTSTRGGSVPRPLAIAQATSPSTQGSVQPSTSGDASFFDLPRGIALFNARDPVVVGTQEGQVHVAKGSLAFVVETGHDVSVYNLYDNHSGGIKVVVGKHLVTIPAGKQLVLTRKQGADFAQINPGTKIGYRNPRPFAIGSGINGFIADFSIPSAMISIPPLKNMLKSPKSSDRRIANQLLKNAVIMADLTPAAGPYIVTK